MKRNIAFALAALAGTLTQGISIALESEGSVQTELNMNANNEEGEIGCGEWKRSRCSDWLRDYSDYDNGEYDNIVEADEIQYRPNCGVDSYGKTGYAPGKTMYRWDFCWWWGPCSSWYHGT